MLSYIDFYYTIDYTENVQLTGHLIQKAIDYGKFNFVFGDSNRNTLSRYGYTFHGSLT